MIFIDDLSVKPAAEIHMSYGVDGRDAYEYIRYHCPKCGYNKRIKEKQQACEKCHTFFDWSKTARIKVVKTVEWV